VCILFIDAIVITEQPKGLVVADGDTVTFSISVKNSRNNQFTYHWTKKNTDLLFFPSQCNPEFVIESVTTAYSGIYYCTVKDESGNEKSSDEVLLKVFGKLPV